MMMACKRTLTNSYSACTSFPFRSLTTQTIETPLTQQQPQESPQPPPDLLDITPMSNLFSSTPTKTLLLSFANLRLISAGPAVKVGSVVMNSPIIMSENDSFLKKSVLKIVKSTVYDHFCAGEDLKEVERTMENLWRVGLKGIMDYGLEDAEASEDCDRNLNEFLKTVDMSTRLPASSVSFGCVKITAICPISLLKRVSDHLRWEYSHPSTGSSSEWKVPSFPVLSDSSPFYHTTYPPPPLTPSEENDLHLAHQRLFTLCQRCSDLNLPLLIDAEYTSVQPAIDHITYSAMREFNKTGERVRPIVYGTVQAYMRDSMERMVLAANAAEKEDVQIALKLVRGAYMSRETKMAGLMNEKSPIHPTIGETHRCYDACLDFMLQKVSGGRGSVVLATHNLESGKHAAAKVEELGIRKNDERLQFAQLKGMAESFSLGLRNAGFNVSKYLAFGPVQMVLPYLLRRAEENRGLLTSSSFDQHLIRDELKRRLKATAGLSII